MESAEIEHLAERVTEKIFLTVGIDISKPPNVIELQKDFAHLRSWRLLVEGARKKTLMTVIGTAAAGACVAIWAFISGKHGGV